MLDNYIEETKPLFKLLKTEAFNFVIVRYNHIKYVRQLQNDLIEKFPDRPSKNFNCSELTYEKLIEEYFSLEKGFLFLEDFGALLKEEKEDEYISMSAADSNRKREILEILNRRRDKLAQYPIALIVFVPATAGNMYARKIMRKMPDMWSFRSLILDIKGDAEMLMPITMVSEPSAEEKADMKKIKNEKRKELKLLLSLLNKTPDEEVNYKLTLYPQIVKIQTFLEKYEDALVIIEEWEKSTEHNVLSIEDFLDYKAAVLLGLERFDELIASCNIRIGILEDDIQNSPIKLDFWKEKGSETLVKVFSKELSPNEYEADIWNLLPKINKLFAYYQFVGFKCDKIDPEISILNLEKSNNLLLSNPTYFISTKLNYYSLLWINYYHIASNYQKLNNKELVITNLKKSTEYLEKLVEEHYDNEQYQYELERLYDYIKQLELKV